ncbi:MAG TPA: DUF4126 domain-containing protein [Thiolapillus brandeum]|uniref:DUF4126 domain-containing protein n=1 Tax=Thiolapillus brandeum TaxID=1076588 RepID=A0A831RY43_9GAMM|nr:DUF4126 domain-containing protein [Thiolapillus brandeum]
MESQTIQSIALMLGAGWASGLNLYAAMLVLGWMGASGQANLPPSLDILSNPMVMGAAGLMFVVEFFADKVPGLDSLWDAVHTFIRIPAGALMAAGAAQGLDMGAAGELIGLILGGSLATTSHVSKASARALINTSPEPVTNWTASVTEDAAVVGGLWTALNYPWLFVLLLILFILLAIWLVPKIWRLLKAAGKTVFSWFRKPQPTETTENTD